MSLGKNISKYRRMRGMTQEALGEMLGVTNQAVSKWENSTSLPDVMLLPGLADALGITLDDLYGRSEDCRDLNRRINEFPRTVQSLAENCLMREILSIATAVDEYGFKKGYTIGVISYTEKGAAFISDKLSVIAPETDIANVGEVFKHSEIFSGMKKLCDGNVRRVLSCMCSVAFADVPRDLSSLAEFGRTHDLFECGFTLGDIAAACGLFEEDALEAVEKLISINFAGVSMESGVTRYILSKTKAVEAAVALTVVERLVREPFQIGCGYVVGHGVI